MVSASVTAPISRTRPEPVNPVTLAKELLALLAEPDADVAELLAEVAEFDALAAEEAAAVAELLALVACVVAIPA